MSEQNAFGILLFQLDGREQPIRLDADEYIRVREWLMSIPNFQKPYTARMASVLRVSHPDLRLRDIVAIDRYICQLSGLTFRLSDEREPLPIINLEVEPSNGEPFIVG